MGKPRVVYYEIQDFQESSLAFLHERFEVTVLPDPGHDTPELLARADALFAPMGHVYNKEKLAACPRVKALGTPTTGFPHIDAEYARQRSIAICSLKEQRDVLQAISCTAELAWGLLVNLAHRIPQAFESVLAGGWDGKSFAADRPRMLSTMSLGVVGLGRLGGYVARYGKAFGMAVRYFDPFLESDEYERCETLEELARQSDVVSLHTHFTPETEKSVNADFFQAMPQGSFLINTARGEIVDEAALVEALESGHLAGAAMDTLSGDFLPDCEKTVFDNPLFQYAERHDNLLLVPRYGGATTDAWESTEKRIINLMLEAVGQDRQGSL